MSLPESTVLEVADALAEAFPGWEHVGELFQAVDVVFAGLTLQGQTLRTSLRHAVGTATREGWLPALLQAACARRPTDAVLEALATRLGGPVAAPADPFASLQLAGGYYMVDREPLRASLRELARPDGQRILVVTGEDQSGKSYTRTLVLHLQQRLGAVVDVDLERLQAMLPPGTDLTPHDLATALVRGLRLPGLRVPEPPTDQQWARWSLAFCEDLYFAASAHGRPCVVMVDAFNKVTPSSAVLDLVKELALLVGRRVVHLRLVLVGFDGALHRDVRPTLRPDRPDVIAQAHVAAFAMGLLGLAQPSLGDEERAARAVAWTSELMAGLTPGEPDYLFHVNDRIVERVDRLLGVAP